MIRPAKFAFNAETAVNNKFQVAMVDANIEANALHEFDSFVKVLTAHGIDVTVVQDTIDPYTPDSIFPNNWISFHENGTIVLYPMFAENRRAERKEHVLEAIRQKFQIKKTIDLTAHEKDNSFLEGTGSMVLDRDNQIAYACLSPRTDKSILNEVCKKIHYCPVAFTAVDANGELIYHTNVMMCVADNYIIICLDSIESVQEKSYLMSMMNNNHKEIIPISIQQMNNFAGNMLQVINNKKEKFLVMSTKAYQSLTDDQIEAIEKYNKIIHSNIVTIETNGGGSARCMMAEVFLPLN